MSQYLVKEQENINIVRAYSAPTVGQGSSPDTDPKRNNLDRWLPFMETLFIVKQQRSVNTQFYLISSELYLPQKDWFPNWNQPGGDTFGARLGVRIHLHKPDAPASAPIVLHDSELQQGENEWPKTHQVSVKQALNPGCYVMVVTLNLKLSVPFVPIWFDPAIDKNMRLTAQKTYLTVT